tara:strand:- start:773 stop:1006 length:234 start_codon:yes stop_codon:yes gene_type:complete
MTSELERLKDAECSDISLIWEKHEADMQCSKYQHPLTDEEWQWVKDEIYSSSLTNELDDLFVNLVEEVFNAREETHA